jgi:flagellar basal body-associated protein FliL
VFLLRRLRPKVRDSVLMLLSSKSVAEVVTVEGKENLRTNSSAG